MPDPFKAQEATNKYFWTAIACLVILNLGMFAYFFHLNGVTKDELTQKASEIQGAVTATDEIAKLTAKELDSAKDKLASTNKRVESVQDSLIQQTKSLQSQLEKQGIQFQNTIQVFKAESEEKISTLKDTVDKSTAELQQKLADIKLESADFSEIIQDVVKSVVSVQSAGDSGSGVVLDDNGYIITNNHVVGSGITAKVIDYNGKAYTANVIRRDVERDLLILKLDNSGLPKLTMGDSTLVRVGEKVLAVGNPAGLKFSVSEGIVSAINRKIDNSGVSFIQTDTPINPGSSGGPLLNKKGEVIGINAKKYQGYEGLGFVIPINMAKDFLEKIKNGE
ncbi:MAG TPA: trypsin-like peptidase domain-containing protein [Candidatus Nanoarchaeia archaeon]|nr:trypsin-like peptidase domain-containing protein [Candidatus Nanoarchaeia archaeon]